jgi:hypothetical protein
VNIDARKFNNLDVLPIFVWLHEKVFCKSKDSGSIRRGARNPSMVLFSGTQRPTEAMTFCIHEMKGGILVEADM